MSSCTIEKVLMMTKLTAKKVENALPRKKEYKLHDGNGLFLRVRPSGAKSWLFSFSLPNNNKLIRMTLGSVKNISLKKARAQLPELHNQVSQGIDPRHVRASKRAENTTAILEKLIMLEHEATNFGFKWETPQQIKEQIISELTEIEVHLHDKDKAKLQEEIGDLLHAAFSLCVFCELDPKITMRKSVEKFERRLKAIKNLAKDEGLNSLNGKSFKELMRFWNKVKELE